MVNHLVGRVGQNLLQANQALVWAPVAENPFARHQRRGLCHCSQGFLMFHPSQIGAGVDWVDIGMTNLSHDLTPNDLLYVGNSPLTTLFQDGEIL